MSRWSASWAFALCTVIAGCGGNAVVGESTRERPTEPDPMPAPTASSTSEPAPMPTEVPPEPLPPLPDLVDAYRQPCDADTPGVPSLPGAYCDDAGWCWDSPLPTGSDLTSITRVGDELWAASARGIFRRTEREWSLLEQFAGTRLIDVVGAADGTAVAAVDTGVFAFDGKLWTPTDITFPVMGIVGNALTGPLAVTRSLVPGAGFVFSSRALRLEGDVWKPVTPDVDGSLTKLSVVSDTEMWGLSDSQVVHLHGDTWTTIDFTAGPWTGTPVDATSISLVFARAAHDVWFGVQGASLNDIERPYDGLTPSHGLLVHWDGKAFRRVPTPDDATSLVTAAYADDGPDVWFGTQLGEYLHWDGTQITSEPSKTRRGVAAFVRDVDGELLSIARGPHGGQSESGALVARRAGSWSDERAVSSLDHATKVWGSAWDDVWAIGTDGLRLHFDGSTWDVAERARSTLTGIWGTSRDDVWTATADGIVEHFDGSTWNVVYETSLRITDLSGIGNGELWTAVDGVGAVRLEDGAIQTFDIENAGGMAAIWATSTRDVWLGGSAIWRFDGRKFVQHPRSVQVTDIWGSGPGNMYVASGSGIWSLDGADLFPRHSSGSAVWGCGEQVFFASGYSVGAFDGNEWTEAQQDSYGITGVWGLSPNFVIAVGWGGQILRKSR